MRNALGAICCKWNLRENLPSPESAIALIITCGFLVNVQQGTDTNAILRNDPLVFKGIRILTVLVAELLAISTLVRRKVPYMIYLTGAMLPFTLYFLSCLLSVPFSAYPLLSLFKTSEVGLVLLTCAIGVTSTVGGPADFFRLNVKLVLLYSLIIWVESFLFPGLAWVKLQGQTPLFGYALSGVFPVINGNMVGLFGAVLFLAYAPGLCESAWASLRHWLPTLIGLASVVFSYSRSALFGLGVAAVCSLLLLKRYALVWAIFLCLALLGTDGKTRALALEHLARGQEDRSLDGFSSHRLAMWDRVLHQYDVSLIGRGYAAGFRYDEDLAVGHAHNSLFELYFNVGVLGVLAWLLLVGAICSGLYRLLRMQATVDYELVSIIGVLIFLLMKAMASTVFVYLDVSMLLMAGIVIYVVRQLAAVEQSEWLLREDHDLLWSY